MICHILLKLVTCTILSRVLMPKCMTARLVASRYWSIKPLNGINCIWCAWNLFVIWVRQEVTLWWLRIMIVKGFKKINILVTDISGPVMLPLHWVVWSEESVLKASQPWTTNLHSAILWSLWKWKCLNWLFKQDIRMHMTFESYRKFRWRSPYGSPGENVHVVEDFWDIQRLDGKVKWVKKL